MPRCWKFVLLFLLLAAAAPVRGQQPRAADKPLRLALVSSEKNETLLKVLALAESRLTEQPGVEVLERAAIERVLSEQKLTLSGLVAAEQAVSIGKLVAVDLFAVLEAGADAREVGGLVIFDAHTGVRLWDAALPGDKFEARVRGVVDAVASAQGKLRADRKLRPICVLTVRNVDLPRDMDAFCDSVALLLERQLVASPDLALLERRRLNQVNRERDLPANAPLRQLLTSMITLELEVGRSAEKNGLRATVLLSDAQGKLLGKKTVTLGKRDAAALSASLFRATADTLEVKSPAAQPEPKREAARFLREAEFFWGHKDPLRALPAAESALALSANDPSLRMAVAYGLLVAANEVLDPGGKGNIGTFVHKVDPDILQRSLALARDGAERLLEVESLPDSVPLTSNGIVHKMFAKTELHNYLIHHVDGLTEGISTAARETIAAIHDTQRRIYAVRLQHLEAKLHDAASFDKYTEELNQVFFHLLDNRQPGAKWVETQGQLRHWVELARKYTPSRSEKSQTVLWFVVGRYRYPPQLTPEQVARLRKLWAEIADSTNPLFAVYGRLGTIATELAFDKLSDEQRWARIHAYRLFVQEQVEKDVIPSSRFRLTLYLAAYNGVEQLLNRKGYGEELKELTEFMLQRKELAPTVAGMAAFHFRAKRTPEGYRYAYDVLRRALSIVDGKEGRFLTFATTPESLRHELDMRRRDFRNAQADIAQADPTAASGLVVSLPGAQTLIDLYPHKEGLLWLYQPVVDQGIINVGAIEMSGSPPRQYALLVRFTPGEQGRWESRKIEVPLRGQPWTEGGQWRLPSSYFGVAACVYRGRYYLGTKDLGIYAFPFDGSAPEKITTAEGLPSNFVQGLDCHDGKLYAYLGEPDLNGNKESYFVAWDIRTRQCEVLASSRRKEKLSPFDDNTPLRCSFFRTDARRKQILFAAHEQHPLNGLWAFDVATKKFHRLFILHNGDVEIVSPSARIEGDLLRMPTNMGVFDYDLAKNDGHLLYDGKLRLEVSLFRSAVHNLQRNPTYRHWTNRSWDAKGPFALAGGWIWAAVPFSRRALDGSPSELLAPLRPDQKFFQPREGLQPFDDQRLLLCDSFGLWLVPFSEKKEKPDHDR